MDEINKLIVDADFGSTEAQLRLAEHYLVDSFEFDKAEKWLLKLVSKNSTYAKYELYKLYNDGRSLGINYSTDEHLEKAQQYLLEAANEKHIQALYDLATKELGSKETQDVGAERLVEAAQLGHEYALMLAEKYDYEIPTALVLAANGDLYNEDAERCSLEARELYLSIELANLGVVTRQTMVGNFYNKRELYTDAFDWYEKAANNGCNTAAFNLAIYHVNFKVYKSDPIKAIPLYERVAAEGDYEAMRALADLYLATKKYGNSLAYYKLAAEFAPSDVEKSEELLRAEKLINSRSDMEMEKEAEDIFNFYLKNTENENQRADNGTS